jgi:hypothetical protein
MKTIFPENCKKSKRKCFHGSFDCRYKFYYRNTCLCVWACVCMYICMAFDIISTELIISIFHWLHLYMTGLKSNWWDLCWECLVSIQWTLCTFLQGRCSCHVTYVGIHHHGRRDVSHWVNTGYRPVRFSLTQPQKPIHIVLIWACFSSHTCAISDSCLILYSWLYSSQPLDGESSVLTYMEAVPNPYYPFQVSQKVPVAQFNLHCLGVEIFKSSGTQG